MEAATLLVPEPPVIGTEFDEMEVNLSALQEHVTGVDEAGEVTQALAVESVSVLGHNTVLKQSFLRYQKAQRLNMAMESYQDKFRELIKKTFDLILSLIRKCIAWIKGVFARRKHTPEEVSKVMHKAYDEARSALHTDAQVASATRTKVTLQGPLRDEAAVKTALDQTDLPKRFFASLSVEEYDVLIEGPYSSKVIELAHVLENSTAIDDLENGLIELNNWYEKKLAETPELDQAHREYQSADAATQQALTVQHGAKHDNFMQALDVDTPSILGAKRKASDELVVLYTHARDIQGDLGAPKPLEGVYDLRGFFQHAAIIMGRYDTVSLSPVLEKWRKRLEQLERDIENAIKVSDDAYNDTLEHDKGVYLSMVHGQYFNALNTIPARVGYMNQAVTMIYRFLDDSTNVFTKQMRYIAEALEAILDKDLDGEISEALRGLKDSLRTLKTVY